MIPNITISSPRATRDELPSPASAGSQQDFDKPRPKKHKDYYRSDGNIILLVEKTLFKLKLSVLQSQSAVFRRFTTPSRKIGAPSLNGSSDKRPLVLHEVKVEEFLFLLAVLYPSQVFHPRTTDRPDDSLSVADRIPSTTHHPQIAEDYLSVLKLATGFQMETIRKLAMNELGRLPIDPVRKISIWEEYQLDPELLKDAYVTLCLRADPLTMSMAMSLGIKNFTKLTACRDYYRQKVGCSSCETCRKTLTRAESERIARDIVAAIFTKSSKN